jgi:hypothetical protein
MASQTTEPNHAIRSRSRYPAKPGAPGGKERHSGILSMEVFDKHDVGFVAVELIVQQPAPVGR